MTQNLRLIALLLLVSAFAFTGCDDDEDPEIPNEEEVITTLNLRLTAASDGEVVTMTFRDLDGDGGMDPVITGGTLEANESYAGAIELLNETETPAEDITAEVAEEDDEHQFFFESSVAGLSVAYGDEDENGNPVGIASTLSTGAAASGTLTITLRHEPVKDAAGVSDGDITNADGETDIEVTLPIDVL